MIHLNSRDSRPIYEQIMDNLRRLIISGGMAPGDRLPSVRELAAQLAINPNTIQRAYRELESEGFIYSVAGKGSFAASIGEIDGGRRTAKLAQFRSAALELLRLGTTRQELTAILEELEQEDSHD